MAKTKPFVAAATKAHETVQAVKNSDVTRKFEELKKAAEADMVRWWRRALEAGMGHDAPGQAMMRQALEQRRNIYAGRPLVGTFQSEG